MIPEDKRTALLKFFHDSVGACLDEDRRNGYGPTNLFRPSLEDELQAYTAMDSLAFGSGKDPRFIVCLLLAYIHEATRRLLVLTEQCATEIAEDIGNNAITYMDKWV